MKLIDYLIKNKSDGRYPMIARIKCTDGFNLSVQCNSANYCSPREDHSSYYSLVEVGFPSAPPTKFLNYAEDQENPTGTVYGYVPIELVADEINSHGGIVDVGLVE